MRSGSRWQIVARNRWLNFAGAVFSWERRSVSGERASQSGAADTGFDLIDRPDLKFPRFIPGLPFFSEKKAHNIFELISKGDILLHHPYQSFQPVIEFIQQAYADPDVIAVKQTVYRTGSDSTLMEALVAAARLGKGSYGSGRVAGPVR